MKKLRHRKCILCLVFICCLSFFVPTFSENNAVIKGIYTEMRKNSGSVQSPDSETLLFDRSDIQTVSPALKEEAVGSGRSVPGMGWKRKSAGPMNWTVFLPAAAMILFAVKDIYSLPGVRKEKLSCRTERMLKTLHDKDGKKRSSIWIKEDQDGRKTRFC